MSDASALTVVPVLHRNEFNDCVVTMDPTFCATVLPVDNWTENRGVAAAWNVGARRVLVDDSYSHLIVLSERVRFGALGGIDFLDALDNTRPDDLGWGCLGATEFGWHLFAIGRRMIETVGLFDEGFFAFYEDTDWLYRAGLAGAPSPRENGRSWPYVGVDGTPGKFGQNIGARGVDLDAARSRYRAKWGGDQGRERFRVPFNWSEQAAT